MSERLSVALSRRSHYWAIFTKSGTEITTSKSEKEFVGVNIAPPLSFIVLQVAL